METRSRSKQKQSGDGVESPSSGNRNDDPPQNNNIYSGGSTAKSETIMKEGVSLPMGTVVMFVSLLLDLLAFTMILPLLPSILDFYGNKEEDSLYNLLTRSVHGFREMVGAPDTPRWNGVLFGGLIGSLYSMLQFISNPIMGAISDVYGRRPVLLLSLVGVSLSHLVWAFSANFTLFVLARIIGGITKGNISISTAVMTDILPPQNRGKGMALVGIAFSLGFLLGPMIGAGLASQVRSHGDQAGMFFFGAAMFALALSLTDLAFVYGFFKETLPMEKRSTSLSGGVRGAADLINPIALFKFSAVPDMKPSDHSSIRRLGMVYFIYMFLYSGLEFTLTFLTHNRFNYDSMQQGRMFFMIGTVMILVQGGYVRRLKQGTEKDLAIRGMAILIPCLVLIGFAFMEVVLYVALILFSFASATVVPCMTTLASSYGKDDQKGTVLGIFRSIGALARAVGPIAASTLYWCAGPTMTYVVGGVLVAVPILLFKAAKYSRSHTE